MLSRIGGAVALAVIAFAAGCQGNASNQDADANAPLSDESKTDVMPDVDEAKLSQKADIGAMVVEEGDPAQSTLIAIELPEENDGTGGVGTGVGLGGSNGMGGESAAERVSGSGGTVIVDPCVGGDMCCGLDNGLYCAVDRTESRAEFSVLCTDGQIAAVIACVDRCVRNSALCDDKGGGSSGGQAGALKQLQPKTSG